MNKIFLFSCLNVLFTRCIQSASRECEISLLYCSEECFYTAVFSDVGLQAVVSAGGPCAGAPLGPESGSRGPDEVQSGPDQTAAGTFIRATLHCCFACELEVERQYFVFCLCFVVFYVFSIRVIPPGLDWDSAGARLPKNKFKKQPLNLLQTLQLKVNSVNTSFYKDCFLHIYIFL